MGPGSSPGRRGYSFAFPRRIAPEFCQKFFAPNNPEGAGNAGCALHPRSRVRIVLRKLHTSIQGSGEHPTFPAQWLYGLWRALPGEPMLCCHRRYAEMNPTQLDARLRASGPHVFAVRSRAVRYRHYQRPPRPVPTTVTIMIRPSEWDGMGEDIAPFDIL